MILHIVSDEKFIDDAYKMFHAAAPGENRFLLVSNRPKQLKYIKETPVEFISEREFLGKKFAKSLDTYDFVVFHSLSSERYLQLIMNAGPKVKFVWIGFGADYYRYLNAPLLMPKTQKLYDQLLSDIEKTPSLKERVKHYFKKKLYLKDINNREKVINRIDFFAPVLPEEYEMVKNAFHEFSPKPIDWNYGTLQILVGNYDTFRPEGDNILLGNSATFTNNHLEAFDVIKKINLEGRRIITPLSYGNPSYKEIIIEEGRRVFDEHFVPLTDFMPLNEYKQILSSCSICIQNYLRQQGTGNSVLMMYLGAKVFLNEANPFYRFLKNNGAILYKMEELSDENISTPLSDEEISNNREVLERFISEDVVLAKTKNLIDTVKAYQRP